MRRKTAVRIVLPAHNEESVLEKSFLRLHAFCKDTLDRYDWEILIASNGSRDRTGAIAARLAGSYDRVEALSLPLAGRGGTLRRAAELNGADYLIYMDVDLSTDLTALPELLTALDYGADAAVGSRHHPGARVVRSLRRELLSRGYNMLLSGLMGVRSFSDAQCGFKAFRLSRLRPLLALVRDREWFFDTEVLVLAEYSGLQIVEIPVRWTEDPDSRVHIPSTIARKLLGLARLRLTARRNAAAMLSPNHAAGRHSST